MYVYTFTIVVQIDIKEYKVSDKCVVDKKINNSACTRTENDSYFCILVVYNNIMKLSLE